MKLLTTVILILLSYCLSAQTTQNNLENKKPIEQLQQQVDDLTLILKEQQNQNNQYLENLKEERLRYMDDYRSDRNILFGLIALLVSVAGIILAVYQNYLTKRSAEKINQKLAKKANMQAFKKAMAARATELELMKYPIKIVTDNTGNDEQAEKLQLLLTDYHFENVSVIDSTTLINNQSFTNEKPEILIITKQCGSGSQLNTFYSSNPKVGLIGFWGQGENTESTLKCGDTYGFANSYGRIYENLMSLLHYMRYLKKYGDA